MKIVIIIAIILFIFAAFLDLKQKGLGYKLMPKALKQFVDKLFNR